MGILEKLTCETLKLTEKRSPRHCSSLLLAFFFAVFIPITTATFLLPFTGNPVKANSPIAKREKVEPWNFNQKRIQFFVENYVWFRNASANISIFPSQKILAAMEKMKSLLHEAGLDEKDWEFLAGTIGINIQLIGLPKNVVDVVKDKFFQSYKNNTTLYEKEENKETPYAKNLFHNAEMYNVAYKAINEKNIKLVTEYKTDIQRVLNEYKRKKLAKDKLDKKKKEYQTASALCRKLASNKFEPNNAGYGVGFGKINQKPALEACSKAATQSNSTSQDRYRFGRVNDKAKRYNSAREWYLKSAQQGYAPAQSNLGVMYENGDGVPKNYRTAREWYFMAARQGYVIAQYNLGVTYENGKSVPKNYRTAREWYLKSAQQGYAPAQYQLGIFYEYSRGGQKSTATAREWYLKAANQGNRYAQNNIGALLYNGSGGPKDTQKAVYWFEKSAKQGNKLAKKNLRIVRNDNLRIGRNNRSRRPTPGNCPGMSSGGFGMACNSATDSMITGTMLGLF